MEAASRGAMEVGAPVGAIKIGKEAGTRVLAASYLPADTEFTCKYLAPRKVRSDYRHGIGYRFQCLVASERDTLGASRRRVGEDKS